MKSFIRLSSPLTLHSLLGDTHVQKRPFSVAKHNAGWPQECPHAKRSTRALAKPEVIHINIDLSWSLLVSRLFCTGIMPVSTSKVLNGLF